MIDPNKKILTIKSYFSKKNLFQVVALEKNQINFDVFPIMDLPDEVLVHILSFLSNYDILRRVAPASRKFRQISQDEHLMKRIEFQFKAEVLSSYDWSENRKEKYCNDFLEVVKKSRNLKVLSMSLKIKSAFSVYWWQIFDELSAIKDQCLELQEFCLTSNASGHIWIYNIFESLFRYLDKCPKMKKIKLGKIKLSSHHGSRILNILESSKLKTVEEFHVVPTGSFDPFQIKSLLEIISKKPNISCIFLTLQKRNFHVVRICREFGLKNKVKIRVSHPGSPFPGYEMP